MRTTSKQGMSLVEIVIGSAIIVTGIIALSSTFSRYVTFALANDRDVQASYITEEGIEAVTFFRERSWSTYIQPLSTTTTYYLAWDTLTTQWKATTTPQYIDGLFLRQFTLGDVKRDANDKIASSGTVDLNTKKLTVTVSYYEGHATSTQSLTTYITNLNGN